MPPLFRHLASCILLLASCIFHPVLAQVYPVQVTPQLIPPYSVYLSDYATPGNEKLRVIVLQRDLSRPAYPIRLSMSVEWNGRVVLRTTRAFNPPAIYLDPGIPMAISGAEIAPYLDSRNLDFIGIDRAQYERTRALPEGQYRIAFTAYDFYRPDVPISAEGNGFYYLTKSEPPMVNFPACGMKIALKTPQQIVFSWMPRNTASPNSALETEYEFSLYETRPAGRNPNDVVLTTQPVFKTRVDVTQLIYGPAEPLLLAEMNYVWRVQAIDRSGRDAFRNNGFSEVCSFYYGGPDVNFEVGIVNDLRAVPESKNRVKIWWTPGMYDGYRVEYRKTGDAAFVWFQSETTGGEVKLHDLEPDTEYETRLQAKKSGFYGPYSDIVKFRMLPDRAAQCGEPAKLPDPNNPGPPLTNAIAGMTVTAGGVDVILMAVTPLEIPGWYKGVCRVTLDYFGGLSYGAIFERIYINENREVSRGRIDVMSEGNEKLIKQQLEEAKKKEEEKKEKGDEGKVVDEAKEIAPIVFAGVIDSVRVNAEEKVVIIDAEGKETAYDRVMLPDGQVKETVIADASGNTYTVSKDGTVSKGATSPGNSNVNASVDDTAGGKFPFFVIYGYDLKRTIYYCTSASLDAHAKSELEAVIKARIKGSTWPDMPEDIVINSDCKLTFQEEFEFSALKGSVSWSEKDKRMFFSNLTSTYDYLYKLNGVPYTLNSRLRIETADLKIGTNTFELEVLTKNNGALYSKVNLQIENGTVDLSNYRLHMDRSNKAYYYYTSGAFIGDEKEGEFPIGEETIQLTLEQKDGESWKAVENAAWKLSNENAGNATKLSLTFNNELSYAQGAVTIPNTTKDILFNFLVKDELKSEQANTILNVMVRGLSAKNEKKRRELFAWSMSTIQQKNASLYNFMTGQKASTQVYIVPKNDAEYLNLTAGIKGTVKGITDVNIRERSLYYPLLEAANIQLDGSTVKNAILISKLETEEKASVKKAITMKTKTDQYNYFYTRIVQYSSELGVLLDKAMTEGVIKDEDLEKLRYKIRFEDVDKFVDMISVQKKVYLNNDNMQEAAISSGEPLERTFAKTLAHELTHIYFKLTQKLDYLTWRVIREKKEAAHDLKDGLDNNCACSAGIGHECFNPENSSVCNEENNYNSVKK
jgi:Fibronectin type III domain